MIQKKYILSIFLLSYVFCNTMAQSQVSSIPFSITEKLPIINEFVDMPPFDVAAYIREDQAAQLDKQKFYRFAKMFVTDLKPENAGQWQKTSKGLVWRLGIRSLDAYSLYITIKPIVLHPGVTIFVYSPDYKEFRGAFTEKNNNSNRTLSVAPISGDKMVIELNIPDGVSLYGKIQICKVYHDYTNKFGKNRTDNKKSSEVVVCREDINCINGKYWQTEKRAVCKVIASGGTGTGTLIGNTKGDKTPYLITAYHVVSDSQFASESIVVFNHETTTCNSEGITEAQSLTGYTLVATTDHKLDFSLLKLNEVPPVSFRPFYAGWDISSTLPQKGVCIHHPWGQPKQIAIEYHPLKTEDFGQDFDTQSTWKVSHWEIGTTGSGSSGAPLFNEQHRLVGTLTGGKSNCDNPIDDYFTKFGLSWNKYPEEQHQLKAWLDPIHSGVSFIDGYDPYGFNAEACDTAWNILNNEALCLSNKGLRWGSISGHSSALYGQFAEKFESPSSIQISGFFMNIAKAYYATPMSYIEVKVWEGTNVPSKEIYSKIVFMKNLKVNTINYLGFDSTLILSGNFFIGYKINLDTQDTLAVYHVKDRGKNGASSMYVYDGTWQNIRDDNTSGISTSLGIGVLACYGAIHKPVANVLNVFPNPCNDFLNIDTPSGLTIQNIECFDYLGRKVSITFKPSEENNTIHFDLPSGIYFLKIRTINQYYILKFIVILLY